MYTLKLLWRFPQVKIRRSFTIGIGISLIPLFFLPLTDKKPATGEKASKYFLKELDSFQEKLSSFKKSAEKKNNRQALYNSFYAARLSYKKLAVLSDYFNPYETKALNSPALPRLESEMTDKVIPPQGFQAIEQLLFQNWTPVSYPELIHLLADMINVVSSMQKERDIELKFKEELLWDAARSATVQLITTGITGFDSPVANYSLPEAKASLDGIKAILLLFKPTLEKKGANYYYPLITLVNKARAYLAQHPQFNHFDRLGFITGYINPFYKQLVTTRIQAGIGIPEGRSAINYSSLSLFSPEALRIDFYSPPQEYWVTPERIQLGKQLFFDPILSGDKSRSCATCHQPAKAFTDGQAKPYAVDNKTLLTRNTPTLWNAGYQTRQFHDSRADILENQLGEVVHNIEEMQGSLKNSVKDLKESSTYFQLFKTAYAGEKDPVNTFTIANAISCYIRSLQSLNSRFDQYIAGNAKKLGPSEKNGFNLFAGKAKCATCHFIPLFNGVIPPYFVETESEVLGVPLTNVKKGAKLDTDLGKFLFTRAAIHKHSFKTPTLRNIELTAPYMHNGVFNTLEEVMDFYNDGGGAGLGIAPENQTLPPEKLKLNKKEISDIILFLKSLTDTSGIGK